MYIYAYTLTYKYTYTHSHSYRNSCTKCTWVLGQALCDVYGCKGKQVARHTVSQYAQATCAECGRRVSGHTASPAVSRSVPTDSPPTFS